ncbi:MAG: hypothetical protein COU46_01475 [Candidatus Niyogibacteria bacterium CG10_big_fil_rev_8_21_14_0_10_42_19]|uniref:EamA domain-containing protein n=1 Tax=Candidatus Niyogibacteria bacterium CG10_big_fil_rev_8_21_14_0_10_42_19 TaxID=1974725 RepID=A0A2H0TG00_9BACT|nr:MAG: hypothetical protein COU46_01475 [Candidatus Niyogibacteria bacterium CG10_big_fil_rev_8_21_14_0_10_42_19]
MPLWIPITVIAYFLNGLAEIVDKVLLSKRIADSVSYTFYSGLLSLGVLVLVPFACLEEGAVCVAFFPILPAGVILLALFSGVALLAALYFLYEAIRISDVSRAVPLIGAISPFFILAMSVFISGDVLLPNEFTALLFFVVGGIFLSFGPSKKEIFNFNSRLIFLTLFAAFFFAVTFFLAKEVFKAAPFISGYVWTRLGSFFAVVFMIVIPSIRRKILKISFKAPVNSFPILVSNKVVGAAGFVLLNYAIALGPVSVVNAMRGVEYLFLFIVTAVISLFSPSILKESLDYRTLLGKGAGIIFIGAGFLFL